MLGKPDFDALAFGAHADDVEICCGGTMAKLSALGRKCAIVTLTQGEMGTRGSVELRAEEFANAAKILGAHAHESLDIRDGAIANTEDNRLKVIHTIRKYRPAVVFAHHWEARHSDHEHASHLVKDACFLAGLQKIETGQPAWRPYKLVYYLNRYEVPASFVVDISDHFKQKMDSIRAYSSQFHRSDEKDNEPQTPISHPTFLEFIETRARQYGVYLGVNYAEPFVVRELLNIEDPVALFSEKNWFAVP